MRARFAVVLALPLLLLAPAFASGRSEGSDDGQARVGQVIDGDTLVLDDGRQVRLVGIQAPKLPLGRPKFPTWPLADEAKAALERLTLNREVRLRLGLRPTDRHNRALAHLYDADGVWIQGAMLQAGLARVYTFSDNRALAAEMLDLEKTARAGRRGIWAEPFYRVRRVTETPQSIDTFQLVEGRPRKVDKVAGQIYLNFGSDWRDDFTIAIPAAGAKLFAQAGIKPESLAGRELRVRGWIKSRNGPLIEATHPEQIEVLGE